MNTWEACEKLPHKERSIDDNYQIVTELDTCLFHTLTNICICFWMKKSHLIFFWWSYFQSLTVSVSESLSWLTIHLKWISHRKCHQRKINSWYVTIDLVPLTGIVLCNLQQLDCSSEPVSRLRKEKALNGALLDPSKHVTGLLGQLCIDVVDTTIENTSVPNFVLDRNKFSSIFVYPAKT